MRKNKWVARIGASLMAGAMALSLVLTAAPADAKKKKAEEKAELDVNGVYHAALGVQTATNLWIQRMAYMEPVQNEMWGTENQDALFYKDNATKEVITTAGTFTDAEIAGNGTYTVSLEGADFLGETTISQMHVATDIPLNDTIKFTDVSLNINGKTIVSFDEAVYEDESPYLTAGMDFLLMNHWRASILNALQEQGIGESADNGYDLLSGSGNDNITVTFTVSGFAYDKAEEEIAEETTASGDEETTDANEGTTQGDDKDGEKSSGGMVAVVIVIVVVVVIAAIVVVRKKKE